MPAKLATEPYREVDLAETMTKVMPMAMTETIAVMRRTALTVASEAKCGANAMK